MEMCFCLKNVKNNQSTHNFSMNPSTSSLLNPLTYFELVPHIYIFESKLFFLELFYCELVELKPFFLELCSCLTVWDIGLWNGESITPLHTPQLNILLYSPPMVSATPIPLPSTTNGVYHCPLPPMVSTTALYHQWYLPLPSTTNGVYHSYATALYHQWCLPLPSTTNGVYHCPLPSMVSTTALYHQWYLPLLYHCPLPPMVSTTPIPLPSTTNGIYHCPLPSMLSTTALYHQCCLPLPSTTNGVYLCPLPPMVSI